jgi:hypothetical protein
MRKRGSYPSGLLGARPTGGRGVRGAGAGGAAIPAVLVTLAPEAGEAFACVLLTPSCQVLCNTRFHERQVATTTTRPQRSKCALYGPSLTGPLRYHSLVLLMVLMCLRAGNKGLRLRIRNLHSRMSHGISFGPPVSIRTTAREAEFTQPRMRSQRAIRSRWVGVILQ